MNPNISQLLDNLEKKRTTINVFAIHALIHHLDFSIEEIAEEFGVPIDVISGFLKSRHTDYMTLKEMPIEKIKTMPDFCTSGNLTHYNKIFEEELKKENNLSLEILYDLIHFSQYSTQKIANIFNVDETMIELFLKNHHIGDSEALKNLPLAEAVTIPNFFAKTQLSKLNYFPLFWAEGGEILRSNDENASSNPRDDFTFSQRS